jgi:transcriptional regulator with XRE-family HTH domain
MAHQLGQGERAVLYQVLREIRHEAGLRQEDLAQRLSRPQSFVSKYERGERRLDVLELRAVCRACNLSLAEFSERLEALITEG